jgi:hypothetical protein
LKFESQGFFFSGNSHHPMPNPFVSVIKGEIPEQHQGSGEEMLKAEFIFEKQNGE